MIKDEFIDLSFEIWMRLLQKTEESYAPQSENIEKQLPLEIPIFPDH